MFQRPPNSPYPDYFEKGHKDFPEWWYYGRYREGIDKYKLHICIHPGEFDEVRDKVHNLLHTSISQGLVSLYKTYSVEDAKDNKGLERQRNSPFVIFLNTNYDDKYLFKMAQLCEKIEILLSDVTSGDERRRANCDLYLSSHIIFRQAIREGETTYTAALDKKADLLKTQGESSVPYQRLCSQMAIIRALNDDFLDKAECLKQIMKSYQEQLEQEKQRLIDKHGENDIKVKIISSKISRVDKEISRIDTEMMKTIEESSFDSEEEMRLARANLLAEFKETTKLAMNFSEELRDLLFTNKSIVRNLVGASSTTKSNLGAIIDPTTINEKIDGAFSSKPLRKEISHEQDSLTLKKSSSHK